MALCDGDVLGALRVAGLASVRTLLVQRLWPHSMLVDQQLRQPLGQRAVPEGDDGHARRGRLGARHLVRHVVPGGDDGHSLEGLVLHVGRAGHRVGGLVLLLCCLVAVCRTCNLLTSCFARGVSHAWYRRL